MQDANGQPVAYTYFRSDENAARQARLLTRDEARQIAANIAKLPEFGHPGARLNQLLLQWRR